MCQIITAGPGDTPALSQVIAQAFCGLPPARWLIPAEATRRALLPGYFAILVEHAMTAGTVHTTPQRSAVALWLPVAAGGPAGPGTGYPARLAKTTGIFAGRFAAFDAALASNHPTGTPHEHLAILAVHPRVQGQGIGTALLRARHTGLDQAGTPVYLEAAAPRNLKLYLRHGYLPTPGAPFHLPGDGPAMFGMWRPAQEPRPG